MSDMLKRFIDDNREAFDSENPDPKLYHELQQRLKGNIIKHKADQKKLFRFIAVAASVVIISVSLYIIYQKNDGSVQRSETADDITAIPDPVFARQIDQYQQIIDRQQAQLKQVQYEQPDLYRQFTDDINQLDSSYRALKTTLEKNPNTEMLLEAMIRNLQIQSELLNRQLSIIKEIKQKSKA